MMILIIVVFSLVILLGMYLLTYVLQSKETPKGLVFIHGPVGVLGIILLIAYAIYYHATPLTAIIIFVLVMLGGFLLIFKDLTGKPIPKWLAVGHGVLALIGFGFLLYFIQR